MSILSVSDGPPMWAQAVFDAGVRLVKEAGEPQVEYNLSGMLYLDASGWILLSVPNPLVRGVFSAINETGIELPKDDKGRGLIAHISVIRPEELEVIGGADKVTERGKQFNYRFGGWYSVEPDNWPEMAKVWYIRVHSPDLQALRRSYGLSSLPNDGKHDFHITVAVRRKGVLGRNDSHKHS